MIDLEDAISAIKQRATQPSNYRQELFNGFVGQAKFEPTKDQHEALWKFADFLTDLSGERQVFILKGYAGTGKTTLVSLITKAVRKYGYNTYLMAPTGRAAKVMAVYSGKPAYTIHRTIFRTTGGRGSETVSWKPQKNYMQNTLFIVDEASMIACSGDENLATPLMQYIFEHPENKLLLVGDTAQLPPVGQTQSLALDEVWLRNKYFVGAETSILKEVIRQKSRSGILANATMLRAELEQGTFDLKFDTKAFKDIYKMTGAKLQEGLEYAYGKFGLEGTLVITRSNKTATLYNQYVRNRILNLESELGSGDLVMVVRNNYTVLDEKSAAGFIANGDFARVRRVTRMQEMHGMRFADVEIELPDYPDQEPFECKVMLDTLHSHSASLDPETNKKFWNSVLADYAHIKNRRERDKALKEDEWLNALQIKFAYALTCHKSQGGQWDAIFVEQGYIPPEEGLTVDTLRWMYTACTRARSELYLVNFKEDFFAKASTGDNQVLYE